jgi:hypothetical protein
MGSIRGFPKFRQLAREVKPLELTWQVLKQLLEEAKLRAFIDQLEAMHPKVCCGGHRSDCLVVVFLLLTFT